MVKQINAFIGKSFFTPMVIMIVLKKQCMLTKFTKILSFVKN